VAWPGLGLKAPALAWPWGGFGFLKPQGQGQKPYKLGAWLWLGLAWARAFVTCRGREAVSVQGVSWREVEYIQGGAKVVGKLRLRAQAVLILVVNGNL